MSAAFRHVEAQRTIIFGQRALDQLDDLVPDGVTLLSTNRHQRLAASLQARARAIIHVPTGRVEDVASALRESIRTQCLVALGGGRVIDVAKALAAADPPRMVIAIPTTLSAAEMTGIHRHARGIPAETARVRPQMVINDPLLSASAPLNQLAANAANALGHAVVAALSDHATPFSSAIAMQAMSYMARGWSPNGLDRPLLALGALLAGWAVDQTGLGLHHVLAQTAVRTASLEHAYANAALLPATLAAMSARKPGLLGPLAADVRELAARLRASAGASGLGALDSDPGLLEQAAKDALARPELDHIAPAPDEAEVLRIYRAARTPAPSDSRPA